MAQGAAYIMPGEPRCFESDDWSRAGHLADKTVTGRGFKIFKIKVSDRQQTVNHHVCLFSAII